MRIKRTNDELKADRPTFDEVQFIPRNPFTLLLENIRSVHNVGSIFRTADGFGVNKIILTGYTACPPRKVLHKTALGAEEVVPWTYYENPLKAAKDIKKEGIPLVLLEQTINSKSLYDVQLEFPACFVIGNEVSGVSESLVAECDIHIEIPMSGIKQSLNVAVSVGVIGYEMLRQYKSLMSSKSFPQVK